ncbi:MAG: hypothetical protein QN545_09730 [Nitrososphaeraceae archaeon]|nr:hypothetical protein [Nitrososphaeraceae archaeon]
MVSASMFLRELSSRLCIVAHVRMPFRAAVTDVPNPLPLELPVTTATSD